jgi:hypothetical protein
MLFEPDLLQPSPVGHWRAYAVSCQGPQRTADSSAPVVQDFPDGRPMRPHASDADLSTSAFRLMGARLLANGADQRVVLAMRSWRSEGPRPEVLGGHL